MTPGIAVLMVLEPLVMAMPSSVRLASRPVTPAPMVRAELVVASVRVPETVSWPAEPLVALTSERREPVVSEMTPGADADGRGVDGGGVGGEGIEELPTAMVWAAAEPIWMLREPLSVSVLGMAWSSWKRSGRAG